MKNRIIVIILTSAIIYLAGSSICSADKSEKKDLSRPPARQTREYIITRIDGTEVKGSFRYLASCKLYKIETTQRLMIDIPEADILAIDDRLIAGKPKLKSKYNTATFEEKLRYFKELKQWNKKAKEFKRDWRKKRPSFKPTNNTPKSSTNTLSKKVTATITRKDGKTITGETAFFMASKTYRVEANSKAIMIPLRNVLKIRVKKPETLATAKEHVKKKEYEKATPILEEIGINYTMLQWNSVAYELLAKCYLETNQPEKCLAVCRLALNYGHPSTGSENMLIYLEILLNLDDVELAKEKVKQLPEKEKKLFQELLKLKQKEQTSLWISLEKIQANPFMLRFSGDNPPAVGTKMGVFTITKYTPKSEKRIAKGKELTVNISEMTLERGKKHITLIAGEKVEYNDYIVHLIDHANNRRHSARIEEEIPIGSHKLRLKSINTEKPSCTMIDEESGAVFTILKAPSKDHL